MEYIKEMARWRRWYLCYDVTLGNTETQFLIETNLCEKNQSDVPSV